jgi:hypothetical protein
MALYRNKSKCLVTFYNPMAAFQVAIPPGHVVDEADHPGVAKNSSFEKVTHLWDWIHDCPGSSVAVVRSYALGDVLMTYAILNTLRPIFEKQDIRVGLFTERRFVPVFAHVNWLMIGTDDQLAMLPELQRQFDIAFILNSVLEKDHSTRATGQKNRLRMLAEALGAEKAVET